MWWSCLNSLVWLVSIIDGCSSWNNTARWETHAALLQMLQSINFLWSVVVRSAGTVTLARTFGSDGHCYTLLLVPARELLQLNQIRNSLFSGQTEVSITGIPLLLREEKSSRTVIPIALFCNSLALRHTDTAYVFFFLNKRKKIINAYGGSAVPCAHSAWGGYITGQDRLNYMRGHFYCSHGFNSQQGNE